MSKQLAISSTFAIFAMAALVLFQTPDRSVLGDGNAMVPVQVEMPSLDLPQPSLIR